jgi:cellobiose phosphorylase
MWTLTVTGLLLLPGWFIAAVSLFCRHADVRWSYHFNTVYQHIGSVLQEASFKLAVLPYEAGFSLHAIGCSLYRQWWAPRRLLDWTSSDQPVAQSGAQSLAQSLAPPGAQSVAQPQLASFYQRMRLSPLLALLMLLLLSSWQQAALPAALPVLLLWALAPLYAWWLSRPLQRQAVSLAPEQRSFLWQSARQTSAFFQTFVTAEQHWLAPDNFQQKPGPVLAHRTSPTNIGLSLLANLSAYDFGFIGPAALLQRTADTFGTLAKLERYQGHFCNWYDTQSLQTLAPRYVSAVDSGNLAGHLLTLKAGLQNLPAEPLLPRQCLQGLLTCLQLVQAAFEAEKKQLSLTVTKAFTLWSVRQQQVLEQAMVTSQTEHSVTASYCCLEQLQRQDQLLLALPGLLPAVLPPTEQAGTELQFWLSAWSAQHQALLAELSWLCPWLASGERPQRSSLAGQLVQTTPDSHVLLQHCVAAMAEVASLLQLQQMTQSWLPQLAAALQSEQTASQRHLLASWLQYLQCAQLRAGQRQNLGQTLQQQCQAFSHQEYEFLFDKSRHLLAVGYNIDEFRRDNSYYDLLASEARLATFVAISQGKLPQQSWFALGRLLTSSAGAAVLVSWSGSMFEYLMPLLVMPSYPGTLLDHSCRVAVQRQIAYGQQQSLPWGVSESGFSTVDASQNYQYHAFGVPGLGLKRGLAEDMVIAPYASMLALLVDASAACQNLQRLSAEGAAGRYGFYEAIDYTPSRLSRGQSRSLVCSFMAHHQGMSLLAIASVLLDQPMQKRFASDPQFQATLLLLQEKVPKSTIVHAHVAEHSQGGAFFDAPVLPIPRPLGAATLVPEVQLLSNGRYHVMLTNAGGGYSHWHQLALTRWREDSTRDHWGSFLYVRDLASGHFWSAAHQPTLVQADSYAAVFSEGRAEFRRREHDFETYSEIVVSPEDDIELRRVRLTNRASSRRTVELTSYSEVVLSAAAADDMQTAFGNLFVQTEILPERHAILCTRRPRSAGEVNCWMFHLLAQNGTAVGAVSYETDRMRFIGRGQTLQAPQVLVGQLPLSGSQGAVLDPIVAIRCLITLDAEQTASLDWITGVAASRAECLALVDKYQDRHFADRVFDIAGTHSAVMLRQINASEADAELYRRLASAVLYSHSQLRADASILLQNRRGQAGLWGYAISGDLPIVLLKISDINQMELARQLIQCHAYWRLKGLAVDLVIWNEDHVGYRQQLQEQILGLIATGTEAQVVDRPGGIFVRMSEQIPNEDRILLQAVARAILVEQRGSLAEQLNRRALLPVQTALLQPQRFSHQQPSPALSTVLPADLLLGNGIGGFSPDGREYCLVTNHSQTTPLPWVNVLANPQFGTVITESGLAYSWSENAHEFRLTPWSDDSVAASGGEAFYLRDEDSGDFWSPTAWPCCGKQPYLIRHGFGYSQFEHEEWAIQSQLLVYVHPVDKVKFSVLTVRNQSARSRKISATGYVQWVLGDLAAKTAAHLVTEIDASSGALFARNSYHSEFSGRVAFFDVDDSSRTLTADRAEFIGRNGSLAAPEAMRRSHLSGRVGAALDPCAAIQLAFTLAPGQQRQIIFRLGAGHDLADARALALRCRQTGEAAQALFAVKQFWAQTLQGVQLQTPDPALNVLANGWLLYQTLACRLWARSGYYQSGGAFGFRDQLQDVQALLHADPQLAKQQIVLAASRQYENGDVQHWWHPPYGRGVRTRCSDDYLWLVATTCRYVRHSGDALLLQTDIGFLTGRPLNADEASYYDLPQRAVVSASLYQHCVLAIEYGLKFGEHGLPLMGSGDWNDGMDLVGVKGKGESVWLGFFLYQVLHEFMPLATAQGDLAFVERCQQAAAQLQQNLQLHGWDGDWFRRAYFDDGTVLGSAVNSECRIDAIAQSWAVLSGATEPTRMWQAMNALDSHLIRRRDGLMQLLTPAFDQSALDPGYIKGYLPGVRENGGQYTHAAIWAAMAFARLGDPARCYQLLNLINPVQHGNSAARVAIYRAEPYVMAADVYASPQHVGRAGWSWYTGSAGWMYQLILGSVAGISREGDFLRITPCIPAHWPGFQLQYRFGSTEYQLQLTQQQQAVVLTSHSDEMASPRRKMQLWLDGVAIEADGIWLQDDQQPHLVRVALTLPE